MTATLWDLIRGAAAAGRYAFSVHADDMLRERAITAWQVVDGLPRGRLLVERPEASPNPVVEVEQLLADGTAVKAVWAYASGPRTALLVTVHFFDQ